MLGTGCKESAWDCAPLPASADEPCESERGAVFGEQKLTIGLVLKVAATCPHGVGFQEPEPEPAAVGDLVGDVDVDDSAALPKLAPPGGAPERVPDSGVRAVAGNNEPIWPPGRTIAAYAGRKSSLIPK